MKPTQGNTPIERFFGGIGMEVPGTEISVETQPLKEADAKLCPYCKEVDVNVDSFSERENYWVSCPACELSSPIVETRAMAIKVWNEITFIGGGNE